MRPHATCGTRAKLSSTLSDLLLPPPLPLQKIKRQLYKSPLSSDIRSQLVIRGARIPILKLSLHSGLQVDVSICNDSGLKAVQYLQQACTTLPALRPLVLVLKLLLREHSLNDVATGGLGSWALANMVMAHLKVRSSGRLRGRAAGMQATELLCRIMCPAAGPGVYRPRNRTLVKLKLLSALPAQAAHRLLVLTSKTAME